MKRVVAGAILAMLAAGTPGLAAGQGVVFGAGLGPTFSLEDGGGTDFHVMGTLRFGREEGDPVAFRVDGMVQFADDELFIGTGNVVYHFATSTDARFRPYVIGGAGIYADGGTDFGINAGAGFDFRAGAVGLFIEGRFHNVFTEDESTNFIPITVGVRLGGGGS